ncbi:ACP S-malonyltransferase [Dickeya solani]|uniref:[acyl-carrier-protein] S-malonyltransferase n=1 Tax=Dickeya solani TaxID=1089444 RepID=A0AAX4F1Z0_9GAMM|nr:ACP S-malonyltransferase [Dickeya solani]WOA53281.1 ACP S-malonyltransferase [Dickeya solani]
MKTVYTFPGQGSQYRTMGYDLFDHYPELVAQANQVLGYDIANLCVKDPQRVLNHTQYTQPALYTVNALTYLERKARGAAAPDFLAGHSLGEYNALFAAGAFDFITGLRLVQKRGQLMSQAPKGAMAALLEINLDEIERILADSGFQHVDIANINSRQQCIISGNYDEVLAPELEQRFLDAGARFVQLNVSAAFHSRCMVDIEREFADFLAEFTFHPLSVPVISNVTARAYPSTGYQTLLTRQISHPVRWYESISWLLAQGYDDFMEVGPGEVLTKLHQRIVDDPMPIGDARPTPLVSPVSTTIQEDKPMQNQSIGPTPATPNKCVFMYAGQGSQYYQMGRVFYHCDGHFRQTMDSLCHKVHMLSGVNLLEKLYGESDYGTEFDDIRYTHPALFCLGYSLTQMLIARGIQPTAVVGHSLGEYIAAVVAGMLRLDDALRLVVEQARLLVQSAPEGGLVVVLASPEIFYSCADVFSRCTLAGVNFDNNFFISGDHAAITGVKQKLADKGILSIALPVRYGFHSDAIDAIKPAYQELLHKTPVFTPAIPVYSSVLGRSVGSLQPADARAYLWQIVRDKIDFSALARSTFTAMQDHFFIDVSATGSLSNFLKYSKGIDCRHGYVLNQFSDGMKSLESLLSQLKA